MPAPPAGQLDEAGATTDLGAADPLVASVFHIREIPSWVKPFSNYVIAGDLPQDEAEVRRIQRRAGAYTIINSELYKRSVSVDGFRVARTRGTTRRTQGFERRVLNV
jgi:hypothetical protein